MRPGASLVLLSLLYLLGLAVDLFASEWPVAVKVAVLVVGVIASFIVYYWQFYRPALRVKEEHLGRLLAVLFETLARKYKDERPGNYDLRINVMRTRRKYTVSRTDGKLVVAPTFVRLDFALGEYTDAEREQEYRIGVGSAGLALERRQPVVFDAAEAQEPRLGLTATQRLVTQHVHSILSVPIYRPGDTEKSALVGILNLDSRSSIAETGFREDNLYELAARYAALIGAAMP